MFCGHFNVSLIFRDEKTKERNNRCNGKYNMTKIEIQVNKGCLMSICNNEMSIYHYPIKFM